MYPSYLGFLVFLVLPVIAWFARKGRLRLLAINLIFSATFIAGSLDLLGIIDQNSLGLIVEGLIALLFIHVLLTEKRKFAFIAISPILLFWLSALLSTILNSTSITQLLLFIKESSFFLVFFWSIYNLRLSIYDVKLINKFLVLLFLSQIVVNICKFAIIGITEGYIGTMSVGGGSQTTAFSLIGISFSFSAYLIKRDKKYLIMILGFLLFAVIGNKRAIAGFAPLILIGVYFISRSNFGRLIRTGLKLRRGFVTLLILFLLTPYLAVTLIPTLNPEHKIGGSFSVAYLAEWGYNYMFPKKSTVKYYGRGEAPLAVMNLLIDRGTANFLLGLGSGHLVTSRFIDLPSSKIGRWADLVSYYYDIGYGARTGFLWIMLQTGLLGVMFYLLFYIRIIPAIYKRFINSIDDYTVVFYLGLIGVFIVFFLDFFTYSVVMFKAPPIVLTFLYLTAVGLKQTMHSAKP